VFRLWQRMFELSFLEAGRKMGRDGLARTSETLGGQCGQRIPHEFCGRCETTTTDHWFVSRYVYWGDFVFIVACISGGTAVTTQLRSAALVSLLQRHERLPLHLYLI